MKLIFYFLSALLVLTSFSHAKKNSRAQLFDIRIQKIHQITRIQLHFTKKIFFEKQELDSNRMENTPRRIFFDFKPATTLSPWKKASFVYLNPWVQKIRLGLQRNRTLRVVFELKDGVELRVQILSNPFSLLIDVGESDELKKHSSLILPLPKHRPVLVGNKLFFPKDPNPLKNQHGHQHFDFRKQDHLKSTFSDIPPPKNFPFPFRFWRILLDPGHGGLEKGAVGATTGLLEKEITLDIAKRVFHYLSKEKKLQIFLTRTSDKTLSLQQRVRLIRQFKPHLFISFHVNSHSDRSIEGISSYYVNDSFQSLSLQQISAPLGTSYFFLSEEKKDLKRVLGSLHLQKNVVVSRMLAQSIQYNLIRHMRTTAFHQVHSQGVRRALFYLLYASGIPSVLLENSFLSNVRDEKRLQDMSYREELAKGISKGILAFVKKARKSWKKETK